MKTIILKALPSEGTHRPLFIGPGFQASPIPPSAAQPFSHIEIHFIDERGELQQTRLYADETTHPFSPDYKGTMPNAAINIAAFVRTQKWTGEKMMLIRMTPDY